MTEQDLVPFAQWFNVLAVTHRLMASEDLKGRMLAEYFDVLRPYPFEAVEQSYQALRRKMKKWPVPADWLEALPAFGSVWRLPPLTDAEYQLNDEAEKLGYEREAVCQCRSCVDAGCFMPPRYVPVIDRDGKTIERRHPHRNSVPVLLGRWIHGDELKRWYAARARFYEMKDKLAIKLPISDLPDDRLKRLTTEAVAVIAETKS